MLLAEMSAEFFNVKDLYTVIALRVANAAMIACSVKRDLTSDRVFDPFVTIYQLDFLLQANILSAESIEISVIECYHRMHVPKVARKVIRKHFQLKVQARRALNSATVPILVDAHVVQHLFR
uniref:(northern house mosquito) hypothetical protein n=1 Tax=Culex pipiens TaxID=7175 RepID=A0A8D8IPZ1_CULPI